MSDRRLGASEVAVGSPLPWPVHDCEGNLLLQKGGVINSSAMLAVILERGRVREGEAHAAKRLRQGEVAPCRPEVEARAVFLRLRSLQSEVAINLQSLRQRGSSDLVADCERLAQEIGQLCELNLDAALAALQVDASEDSGDTAANSLQGAVLCEMLGRALGMDGPSRHIMLCAALTHDLGMLALADGLIRQKGALSPEQRERMQRHAAEGCELLRASGVQDERWLRAVAEHHERLDGSGYPAGLVGDAISQEARILAVVDIYSAMLRPRAYRGAMQSRGVLREIFLERGKQVDESLAALFIREIGVHPPGTLVRLESGEVAMVVRRGGLATAPQLKVVIAASGEPVARPDWRAVDQAGGKITGNEPVARFRSLLGRLHQLWEDAGAVRPA